MPDIDDLISRGRYHHRLTHGLALWLLIGISQAKDTLPVVPISDVTHATACLYLKSPVDVSAPIWHAIYGTLIRRYCSSVSVLFYCLFTLVTLMLRVSQRRYRLYAPFIEQISDEKIDDKRLPTRRAYCHASSPSEAAARFTTMTY